MLFYYQIFNAFSGSTPIDSINLLIFNLVYTSLPIIVVGVADQDLRAPVLMKEKGLYREGQCSQVYTRLDFWLTVLDAFYQSAVVFFVAFGVSQWVESENRSLLLDVVPHFSSLPQPSRPT